MNDTNSSEGAAVDMNPGAAGEAPTAQAAAEAKAAENWNSYLRAVAEFDNFRKRTERELDNARKFAIERFAQELVGVGDSLEGAQATLKQLQRAFDKAGIKLIDPAGQPFDPEWHEAMAVQESRDQPPNTVLSVIQKGYSLNGRLLRPARVIVSKAPAGDAN